MVSKNNIKLKNEKAAERGEQHFGFRKLTTGALASVLLGTALYMGTTVSNAKAATIDSAGSNGRTEVIDHEQPNVVSESKKTNELVLKKSDSAGKTDAQSNLAGNKDAVAKTATDDSDGSNSKTESIDSKQPNVASDAKTKDELELKKVDSKEADQTKASLSDSKLAVANDTTTNSGSSDTSATDSANPFPPDNIQSGTFNGKHNEATGETTWDHSSITYNKVKTPVVPGYFANKEWAGGLTSTPGHPKVEETVYFNPLGYIVPVDENGKQIDADGTKNVTLGKYDENGTWILGQGYDTVTVPKDSVQYKNDPDNATKVAATNVPILPGWTVATTGQAAGVNVDASDPNKSTVIPVNPGENTLVRYVRDKASAKVTYIDDTTGKTLTTVDLNGKAGEPINFTPANNQTKTYEDNGYELVSSDIPTVVTDFDDNNDSNGVTQAWTVHLKHGTTTVDGNDPKHPTDGTPINPNGNPNGPKYTGDETNVEADHTFTVNYTGSDNNPKDNVEKTHWTRSVTVDKVTGKELSSTPWVTKDSYTPVNTPVVTGYVADKKQATIEQAAGYNGKVEPKDYTETVTYSKVGNFVPVDPSGKTIPGTTPQPYKNDPDDPTKVTPNEDTPVVPGYHTNTPKLTPSDPTKDTPVPYTPQTTSVTPDKPSTPAIPNSKPDNDKDEPNTPDAPLPKTYDSKKKDTTPSVKRHIGDKMSSTNQVTGKIEKRSNKNDSEQRSDLFKVANNVSVRRLFIQGKTKELPMTGDKNTNSIALIGLMFVSLAGLSFLAIDRKKH